MKSCHSVMDKSLTEVQLEPHVSKVIFIFDIDGIIKGKFGVFEHNSVAKLLLYTLPRVDILEKTDEKTNMLDMFVIMLDNNVIWVAFGFCYR